MINNGNERIRVMFGENLQVPMAMRAARGKKITINKPIGYSGNVPKFQDMPALGFASLLKNNLLSNNSLGTDDSPIPINDLSFMPVKESGKPKSNISGYFIGVPGDNEYDITNVFNDNSPDKSVFLLVIPKVKNDLDIAGKSVAGECDSPKMPLFSDITDNIDLAKKLTSDGKEVILTQIGAAKDEQNEEIAALKEMAVQILHELQNDLQFNGKPFVLRLSFMNRDDVGFENPDNIEVFNASGMQKKGALLRISNWRETLAEQVEVKGETRKHVNIPDKVHDELPVIGVKFIYTRSTEVAEEIENKSYTSGNDAKLEKQASKTAGKNYGEIRAQKVTLPGRKRGVIIENKSGLLYKGFTSSWKSSEAKAVLAKESVTATGVSPSVSRYSHNQPEQTVKVNLTQAKSVNNEDHNNKTANEPEETVKREYKLAGHMRLTYVNKEDKSEITAKTINNEKTGAERSVKRKTNIQYNKVKAEQKESVMSNHKENDLKLIALEIEIIHDKKSPEKPAIVNRRSAEFTGITDIPIPTNNVEKKAFTLVKKNKTKSIIPNLRNDMQFENKIFTANPAKLDNELVKVSEKVINKYFNYQADLSEYSDEKFSSGLIGKRKVKIKEISTDKKNIFKNEKTNIKLKNEGNERKLFQVKEYNTDKTKPFEQREHENRNVIQNGELKVEYRETEAVNRGADIDNGKNEKQFDKTAKHNVSYADHRLPNLKKVASDNKNMIEEANIDKRFTASISDITKEKSAETKNDQKENKEKSKDLSGNTGKNISGEKVSSQVEEGRNVFSVFNRNNELKTEQPVIVKGEKVYPRKMMKDVYHKIKLKMGDGKADIVIKLNPESLGKLNIKMHMEANSAILIMTADSKESKELLNKHMYLLKENLSNQGIKVERIEVSVAQEKGGAAFNERSPEFSEHQQRKWNDESNKYTSSSKKDWKKDKEDIVRELTLEMEREFSANGQQPIDITI